MAEVASIVLALGFYTWFAVTVFSGLREALSPRVKKPSPAAPAGGTETVVER